MKHTVFFSLILGLAFTAVSCDSKKSSGETTEEQDSTKLVAGKYLNEKFGFGITYPSEYLTPDTILVSDSGQVFKSEDGLANLKVWIDPRVTPVEGEAINLQPLYDEDIAYKSGYEITYKTYATTSYTIQGIIAGQIIFFQKTIISHGNVVTGLFRYKGDVPEKNTYDAMTAPLFNSFR
ncbi:MAG: hypothetical protein LBR34_09465 [Prevotella sp.]|nr:hypothetical protein [Prevotella sp.]